MMSRASSVEDRIAEIREYVEREKRGEVVSDRYSAARLLDATVYLLERVEELEGALHREDRSDDGAGLIPAVEWMLDIIEMYEERLIQFGDPPEKVRSDINECAKAKARRDLDRARQALDTGDDDADRR